MAGAIRELTAEQGADHRDAVVLAFGGAGPMFGCLLAEELGARTVIVPPNAGNFSAVGLMQAEFARSAARTHVTVLTDEALQVLIGIAADLLAGLGPRDDDSVVETLLDLRYRGQEHTRTLVFGPPEELPPAADIAAAFSADYRQAYGHELTEPVQAVTVRVHRGSRPAAAAGLVSARPWPRDPQPARLWSFTRRCWVDTEAVTDTGLPVAGRPGPLLVLSETTTTYVDAGYTARRGRDGAVVIERVVIERTEARR